MFTDLRSKIRFFLWIINKHRRTRFTSFIESFISKDISSLIFFVSYIEDGSNLNRYVVNCHNEYNEFHKVNLAEGVVHKFHIYLYCYIIFSFALSCIYWTKSTSENSRWTYLIIHLHGVLFYGMNNTLNLSWFG